MQVQWLLLFGLLCVCINVMEAEQQVCNIAEMCTHCIPLKHTA